ncbi:ATP-binding cassette sub-family G member 1-like isoform X1 [Microplitis mediator]|uniref:ATP-binding cassette sub-family G member 1-like isoform X1 n=2 Tax=Microplitis mediator TaxID=375433 RepID=UPI0025557639|nr:ATP-binding cassette sub-family G member 1-like isoform X1 [Microplitis mediator]
MEERMLPINTSRSLNLTFDGLSYCVKTGILRRESRQLLTTVSGEFRVGELTAIMGPSGAGKSTLMDILAGFTVQKSGTVSVNGNPRDLAEFRRSSAYIMQDDHLEPLLTVEESVYIAANLKLGWNYHDNAQRVDQIIFALGLESCRHTRTSFLSGGQKKRLAMALELVNNPPVMFFDEPTSGLDSVTSKQCIKLMQELAREGPCTIIINIHQPSAILFDMIDHLYVIVGGRCVYTGSTKAIVPFLAKHGLHCPTYHNPADFLMEVCNGEYGDWNDKLVESIDNGKCNDWKSESNKNIPWRLRSKFNPEVPRDQNDDNVADDDKEDDKITENNSVDYATGFCQQLYILIKRNAIKLSRDRVLTFTRLSMHCIIALIVGIIYYGIGEDAAYALDNFNLLFFSLMFLMFSAFSATIITFPLSLPIVTREHFNRWYKLRSFYLANQLADLPIQIIAVTIYTYIVYFMTGQILEVRRFVLWSMVCVVVSLVAQLIGVIVGIALSIHNSVIFGPLFIMPFVVFSGFFVHLNDAPVFLQWFFHSSFLKYGFECAMASMYGFERPKMHCSQEYCHFVYPSKLMKEMGMTNVNYWFSFIILIILYFILDLIAFITLRLRLKKII